MKLIEQILEDGLELKRENTYLYGKYKRFIILSYLTNLSQSVSTLVTRISIKSDLENYKEKVNDYLNSLDKTKLGITYFQINDYFCEIHISNGFQGKMIKQVNEVIPQFIDFLISERFESGCQLCGESNVEFFEFENSYCALCKNCENKIKIECEEEKAARANQKSNVISGIVGALIGSLLGVLAWVIIYNLRIYSELSRINYSSLCNKRL